MANTVEVIIRGKVPFTIGEKPEMLKWLGRMNRPSFGFHITYGKETYVPNEFGGKTVTYDFEITGMESMWISGAADLLYWLVESGAQIREAVARDIDYLGENAEFFSLEPIQKK